MRNKLIVASVLLPMLYASSASAGCTADATAVKSWMGRKPGDADFFTKFKVTPEGCKGLCDGYIKYKLHYYDPSGKKFYESGIEHWSMDSDEQRSVEVVAEDMSGLCDESDQKCEIIDVELKEVSCSD